MAITTNIAWTDSTFNPWIGCTKVGPGCDHCYAEASDRRFYGGVHWGAGAARHRTSEAYWKKPLSWDKAAAATGNRHLVFCASQADVFDNEVNPSWRADLWAPIRSTPNLTWQLVTKRSSNISRMLPPDWGNGYPNVWLLITVVNQEECDRDVPRLLEIPAVVRGLSVEPQINRVDITGFMGLGVDDNNRGLQWVICGGESAQFGRCRVFDLTWAISLADDCAAMRIPFFMKQTGSRPLLNGDPFPVIGKGDNPADWPANICIREFPEG